MRYKPFSIQREIILDNARIKCLFAAKRSGKSEVMYIESVIKAEKQPGYIDNGIDPYQIGLISPTEAMLTRLTFPKFRTFAKPFEESYLKQEKTIHWNSNNTKIMGFSGEKISRMEGQKLHHIQIDEVFQMKEEVFYEALARVSDSGGTITLGGSLGTNINNPKNHWAYKLFIDNYFNDSRVWVWTTMDNPHFPKEELRQLKDTLDPRTYRQLFEIDWDVPGTALVYDEFETANIVRSHTYNDKLETYASVDWGWTHPMACLYFQYDPKKDTVYLFDEIVSSKIRREELWERMKAKPYKINEYFCDIAGNQEREVAESNISWFRKNHNIHFTARSSAINYGVTIVRNYIKTVNGQRKFYVDEVRCPKSVDNLRNYSYPEKDGNILNENPVKKDDDCCDAIRYFFVNKLDSTLAQKSFGQVDRWGAQAWRSVK